MGKDNGGPAFPEFGRERTYANDADRFGRYEYVAVGGMSLRDYFAGQALMGMLASQMDVGGDLMASAAYLYADQMLLERAK